MRGAKFLSLFAMRYSLFALTLIALKTLTPEPLAPIRPHLPEMDEFWTPAPAPLGRSTGAGMKEDLQHVAAL